MLFWTGVLIEFKELILFDVFISTILLFNGGFLLIDLSIIADEFLLLITGAELNYGV